MGEDSPRDTRCRRQRTYYVKLGAFFGLPKKPFKEGGGVVVFFPNFSSNFDQVLCHSGMTRRLEPATRSHELHQQGVSRLSDILDIRDGVRTP